MAAVQRAPHALVHYLRELSNDFHTYYNAHQFLVDDAELRDARLTGTGLRQVVRNGLGLLACRPPRRCKRGAAVPARRSAGLQARQAPHSGGGPGFNGWWGSASALRSARRGTGGAPVPLPARSRRRGAAAAAATPPASARRRRMMRPCRWVPGLTSRSTTCCQAGSGCARRPVERGPAGGRCRRATSRCRRARSSRWPRLRSCRRSWRSTVWTPRSTLFARRRDLLRVRIGPIATVKSWT